jgi:hypothetical protein
MDPTCYSKFNRLVTLAMDAQRSLRSIGLIEVPDILTRMRDKLSSSMTYDMQVYTIYIWCPGGTITFMNSSKYCAECLSGPIQLGRFTGVDLWVWSRLAAMYVWRLSRQVMPFPVGIDSLEYMTEGEIDAIGESAVTVARPSQLSWDEFLSGEALLELVMHKRATYCPVSSVRQDYGRPVWFRGADDGFLRPEDVVMRDHPLPDAP